MTASLKNRRKNPPYYKLALKRILAMRAAGQAENITIMCGALGQLFAHEHQQWKGAVLWLPHDADPALFDWSWLRGHDVLIRGHGEWRPAQETALAIELLEAGVLLCVASRFSEVGGFESMKSYGGRHDNYA